MIIIVTPWFNLTCPMIAVINFGIIALCHLKQLADCADFQEVGGLRQFLRRRTGPQVKSELDTIASACTINTMNYQMEDGKKKKIIGFELRQHPTNLASTVFGFLNSAVTEFSKTLDVINDLEKEYGANDYEESGKPLAKFVKDAKRANIVSKLLAGAYKDFDSDSSDSGINSGSSDVDVPTRHFSDLCCIEVVGNEDKSKYNTDGEYHAKRVISQENEIDTLISDNLKILDQSLEFASINTSFEPELFDTESTLAQLESYSMAVAPVVSRRKLHQSKLLENRSDVLILSDSDSESWEKVEKYMIENVQVMTKDPSVAQIIRSFGRNQKSVVDFLAILFVKLAKRIFFHPPTSKKLSAATKSDSFEDFVTDFDEVLLQSGQTEKYKVLNFETAHRILFYNDVRGKEDVDWCLVLPTEQNFAAAHSHVSNVNAADMRTIEADLPRLPKKYFEFFAERQERAPLETDKAVLLDKIRSILVFIMAFESKEITSSDGDFNALKSLVQSVTVFGSSTNRQIFYMQGFDSIIAYFAINFELECAGPLAYRFFQLYMGEIIGVRPEESRDVVRKIDARAVDIVRLYLRDQVGGALVLDFEIILGILELYPFSDSNASILYFNSVTTWTDLDRLVQFLLLKVPQSQAYKSISLLAAANMLFSMLALDKLFKDELFGSEQWKELKEQVSLANNKKDRREMLDSVVLQFMGDLFILLKDKIVHANEEFDEFLQVAESLVPFLEK